MIDATRVAWHNGIFGMRKLSLLTATSVGAVLTGVGLLCAGQALADVSVNTARTTGVVTSSDGHVTVTSAGSITLTSGSAVVVDSDHNVTIEGPINLASSADNSKGIFVNGGHTSNILIANTITVTDNYTPTDTNSDGIADGEFAQGTGRYGLHSSGATPLVGNIEIAAARAASGSITARSAGKIVVQGNDSYGVRLENRLDGSFKTKGTIDVIGTNSVGLSLEDGATGNVYISGVIGTQGQNSSAIRLKGNFDGRLTIDATVSATGFATPNALSDEAYAKLKPENIYLNSAAIDISASAAKGVVFGSIQANNVDTNIDDTIDSNPDEDGNGILDAEQASANISQYGSAPALRIASADQDITLGSIDLLATSLPANAPDYDYGLWIKGSIQAHGNFQGITSNAIQLGGLGHNVSITNGVGIDGAVTTSAYKADTTAIRVGAGTITPRLDVNGLVQAIVISDSDKTTRVIDIESGANLPTLTVGRNMSIKADARGSKTRAVALRDQSNTLTDLTLKGALVATITASDDNKDGTVDTVVNRAIALDTSSNTAALAINLIDDSTATTDGNPAIFGDVLLGSGNDSIIADGGTITGNINFGAGQNSLTLKNGATYSGFMTTSGDVAIDIIKGKATLTSGATLPVSTLHMGADGTLALSLNTDLPATPALAATGAATFDNGADLQLTLSKLALTPTRFTVMTASNINLGTVDLTGTDGNTPYIYNATLSKSTDNTTLYADFRLKNQTEGAYSDNEYAALMPVLTAAHDNSAATAALLAPTTEQGFREIYAQFMPDYSGETLLGLSHSATALGESFESLSFLPKDGQTQYWAQEQGYKQTRDEAATAGFESTGFTFSAGREKAMGTKSALGIYVAYSSASPSDTYAGGRELMTASDFTVGGYWRMKSENIRAWAHAGVGYTSFETDRALLTPQINTKASGKWSGHSFSAGAGAAYEKKIGKFTVTPVVSASYYSLSEGGYSESGDSDAFKLIVGEREGSLLVARTVVKIRYDGWGAIKPEAWLGYKSIVTGNIGDTKVKFRNGADFILQGGDVSGSGALGGVRLFMDSEWSYFAVEASFEQSDEVTDKNVAVRTRFQF